MTAAAGTIDPTARHRYLRRLRRWADGHVPPPHPERDDLAWAASSAIADALGGAVPRAAAPCPIDDLPPVPDGADVCLAGDAWAVLRAPGDGRRAGAVYTPPDIARRLVDLAIEHLGRVPATVWDPAVGGGAFLAATADALVAAGVEPDEALLRLRGTDLDLHAITLADAALTAWARAKGAATTATLEHGNAFSSPPVDVDLVVGNPPFLGQLASVTSRSPEGRAAAEALLGTAAGYADAAGLFLVLAVDSLTPAGVAALVQPQSLLAARDAAAVRARVTARAALTALWLIDETVFPAVVHTCVPVVRRVPDPPGDVELLRGRAGTPAGRSPAPPIGGPWSGLAADARGVPPAGGAGPQVLGDVATITADFRDAFYDVAHNVREAVGDEPDPARGTAAVVSTALIEPASCLWGSRPARIAGRDWERPVVAVDALGPWATQRLVPKVLVATQTRVVEAVADAEGELLPLTPVITVASPAGRCWHVLAALIDPWATAWLLRQAAGTARSPDRLKVSASLVRQLPLPDEGDEWDDAASALADGGTAGLDDAARHVLRARGIPAVEAERLLAWWTAIR